MKPRFIPLAVLALVVACMDPVGTPSAARSGDAPDGPMFVAGGNGVVHRASVGSHDADLFGNTDANFSLIAVEHGDGSVTGEWTDQFGQGEGGVHVRVNCLSVLGNQAWVSGVITQGNFLGTDLSGLPAITRVADNGTSANDPPDAISFTFIGNPTPCTVRPNLLLLPTTDGQVKVD